jgi:hypothetical protein
VECVVRAHPVVAELVGIDVGHRRIGELVVRRDQRALPSQVAVLDRAAQRSRLHEDANIGERGEVGGAYLDDGESQLR